MYAKQSLYEFLYGKDDALSNGETLMSIEWILIELPQKNRK